MLVYRQPCYCLQTSLLLPTDNLVIAYIQTYCLATAYIDTDLKMLVYIDNLVIAYVQTLLLPTDNLVIAYVQT